MRPGLKSIDPHCMCTQKVYPDALEELEPGHGGATPLLLSGSRMVCRGGLSADPASCIMYSIITQSGEERIQCVPKFTTSYIRYGGSLTHTPTIFIPRSCNERMAELFVSTEVRPTAFVWLDPTTTHPRATHAHAHVIGFTRCTHICTRIHRRWRG